MGKAVSALRKKDGIKRSGKGYVWLTGYGFLGTVSWERRKFCCNYPNNNYTKH
jgi:hypothetical protein